MKKKTYAKPTLISEEFIPNEYVAICYTLACTVGTDTNENHTEKDHTGDCSNPDKNVFSVENGKVTVRENNRDQGWLECTLTSNGNWENVHPGMKITWTTSSSDGRTWYHQGTIGEQKTGHPLMS